MDLILWRHAQAVDADESLDDLKRFTCVDYPHGSRTSILALANEPQMIGTTIKTMRSLRVCRHGHGLGADVIAYACFYRVSGVQLENRLHLIRRKRG